MTWFKQISVKEYDDLIKNKNKIYNITPHFTSSYYQINIEMMITYIKN